MRRGRAEPNRVPVQQKKRVGRGNDSSKALYYTLASSTVLEKNNYNGSAKELDSVFLAAAKYGDMDILIRTLDRHNININVRDDENGDTALILAAKGNNSKVVEALVERGADVTVLNESGKGALDIASNFLKLAVLSKYPKNPAHTAVAVVKAAWQGDIVSLKNILATHSGSKLVDIASDEGLTPLLVVTRDINAFIRLQRSVKLSYDPTKVIQELLRHKANVNATDLEGHTALHFATRISGHKLCRDIVELLLVYKPLINMLDRTNLTPLHTATNNDNAPVVSALVEAGANPNLHGIGGATPLHIGAQQENEDIIRKLVLAGGDVNALDCAGMTPLCVARSQKIRELMKTLFADLAADKGIEIKLKYDELASKRKYQKMLEVPKEVEVVREEIVPLDRPDFRPLQRALINDTQRGSYDYDVNQRVPRLLEGKKVTLDISARRRSSVKSAAGLLPRIDPENAVLLLKRHSPIEVPVLQRNQSRLKDIGRGVFITQRQNSRQKKNQNDMPRSRPPIPKHTCGFVKAERNGSAKTRKSDKTSTVSLSGTPYGPENEQWLPGAPIILAGSTDNSRPTSAVTGSSSLSTKGPQIHLKNVLKSILANMEKNQGSIGRDLLDRYVQQQRPIKVKEMGFVDFLLQDDDPEKRSLASSSVRSNHMSDSSSLSGMSAVSSTVLTDPSPAPLVAMDTSGLSRITIGETTPQMQSLNLPQLRQMPAPAPEHPLRAKLHDRKASLEVPRPHELVLRRNSTEDGRKMSIVTISSPYVSPTDNPKISSRSSRDSGYGGSLATLLNRSQQSTDSQDQRDSRFVAQGSHVEPPDGDEVPHATKIDSGQAENISRPETAELVPPTHVTLVVVSKDPQEEDPKPEALPKDDISDDEDSIKEEIQSESPDDSREKNIKTEILPSKVGTVKHKQPSDNRSQQDSGPILGVPHIGVLQGQRMKTVPKLLNNRPVNKFKEITFKKKIYNRKLPQIKEESRMRRDSVVTRLKNRERQTSKSARSGTSESSGEKETTYHIDTSRPGTVPSKPVLGMNITTKPKQRPKTSVYAKVEYISSENMEDPDKIPDEQIEKEIKEITNKHDKKLLNRLSSMKDLNKLVSSTPLKVEKPIENGENLPKIEIEEANSPSDEFRMNKFDTRSHRSGITTFTATTRIESIMGETTQWKKGRLLGCGGGGKVWFGETQEKIEVAVKQLELSAEQDDAKDEYLELQEEIKLLKCLKHENIVRYYGTCLQDNFINIFMEYVDGGSLAARIKKQGGSLQERSIQNITYQLLDAMKYIHAKNIVHRDIKGQNVLVTPDDRVKLIDFGCGKRLRRSIQNTEHLKTMRGTPYWMSPEVITGSGHGMKSDVWSLSCTVYEMLTGNPPWHSLPTMAAIYKIGTGRPIPSYPENASDYCIDFMKACFVVDTKVRPSAEELLKHEFIELFSNRIKGEQGQK